MKSSHLEKDRKSGIAEILGQLNAQLAANQPAFVNRPDKGSPSAPSLTASLAPSPAALYQDAGGGYNSNFVFPQN